MGIGMGIGYWVGYSVWISPGDGLRYRARYSVNKSPLMSQVRVQTTGIIEYNFPLVFRKDLTRDCIFIDVGGQRNERKKW